MHEMKVRGCGMRKAGGIYAVTALAEDGLPLEEFLMDPPVRIDPTTIGLSPRGAVLVKAPNADACHVVDWVGEMFYPNVADILEEVAHMGMSRRLPKSFEFHRLTRKSQHILVHRKGWIERRAEYVEDWVNDAEIRFPVCPKGNASDMGHPDGLSERDGMCVSFYWQDIEPADNAKRVKLSSRLAVVEHACFSYKAAMRPEGHVPEYYPAIFASFPINRLEVVIDPEGGTHEEAMRKAQAAKLPVLLMEE